MLRKPAIFISSVVVCLLLSSCAGFRGGWESMPYIGNPPRTPSVYRTSYEAGERSELSLPGLKVRIDLNNRIRDSHYQVYGVAPVPKDSSEIRASLIKAERISLRLEVREEGFVFRPRLAVLGATDKTASAIAGYERGRYDLSGYKGGFLKEPIPIAEEYILSPGIYYLFVEFPLPVPAPQTADITLDLSKALQAPGKPPIPLIRFLSVRWEEGYS